MTLYWLLVPAEEGLIGSVGVPRLPHDLGLAGLAPRLLPQPPHVEVDIKPSAPSAAQDVSAVMRMIPHEVKRLFRLEPFANGGEFAIVESRVQIPRHVVSHLYG